MTRRIVVTAVCCLLVCAATGVAGRLYARRPLTASPLYNLRLDSVRSTVTIRNLLAITHVDETFYNPEAITLEGFYVFQLPEGATVDGLWMWVDGERYTFQVKRKEAAQKYYDSLVQQGIGDPALLESLGANRFQLRVFPIHPKASRRIELRYFQVLRMSERGEAMYRYPLAIADYQTVPVQYTRLRVRLDSDFPLEDPTTNFDSLGASVTLLRTDTSHVDVEFEKQDLSTTSDLQILFLQHGWFDTFPSLHYMLPDTVTDGYFMLWTPPRVDAAIEHSSADFVFALDASGSMTGLRINVVRETVSRILGMLQPYDRFRIVLFSGDAVSYPSDTSMLFATPENVGTTLMAFYNAYQPRGVTDYGAGIAAALSSAFRAEADHRLMFVTDGLPNKGPRSAVQIDSALHAFPGKYMRFYPVAMYTENVLPLSEAAALNSGRLVAIEQADSIATVLRDLTFDFSTPVLRNVKLELPPEIYHVYPDSFGVFPVLNDLLTTGREQDRLSRNVTLNYWDANALKDVSLTRAVRFVADSLEPIQVARFWAAKCIADLLGDLRFVTDSTEIRESVIRLSERFNILSPFTAYLVVKDPKPNTNEITEGEAIVPERMLLRGNHPNPFNPSTRIEYYLPDSHWGRPLLLRIHDGRGRVVRTLLNTTARGGLQTAEWDGCDDKGTPLPSGVYFCVLSCGHERAFITMTLAR